MSNYCYNCMKAITDDCAYCPHCGKKPSRDNQNHQLKTGTLLHGRFLVGRVLGQGGFGITYYIGLDNILGLRVVIKEYYPNGYAYRDNSVAHTVTITDSGAELFRHGKDIFLNEARMLARFHGEPGIVTVRDYFEENNTAYIVMDYLEGETLNHFVETKGKISADQLFQMVRPVIQALGKVHEQGIMYQVLCPRNILVLPWGELKLLDFSAAIEVANEEAKSCSIVVNKGYAPPEQYLMRKEQGPWTDVYALCATMYYCLTGTAPEESLERLMNSDSRLIPPSELGAAITPEQENVILRGMAINAAERYQSMGALKRALDIEDTLI